MLSAAIEGLDNDQATQGARAIGTVACGSQIITLLRHMVAGRSSGCRQHMPSLYIT